MPYDVTEQQQQQYHVTGGCKNRLVFGFLHGDYPYVSAESDTLLTLSLR